ncbi:MAG: hypothetical protein IIA88_07860 [Bacteroidetes bacterium]|nr:hypothetical protein [Bacteroidota bacterium]
MKRDSNTVIISEIQWKGLNFKQLNEIINKAQFDYYSKPDKSDAKTTLGFLNYKIYVIINGAKHEVKISVRIDKNGQYYYNHYITK